LSILTSLQLPACKAVSQRIVGRGTLEHGTPAAKAQGGDRRSARIEAQAGFLLGAIKEKDDITLSEPQGLLAKRGTAVGIGTLWRFFDRHGITRKKPRTAKSAVP
jgi:transposase